MIDIKTEFLNKDEFSIITNCVNSIDFPWYWTDKSNYPVSYEERVSSNSLKEILRTEEYIDYPQFYHDIINENGQTSRYFNLFANLIISKLLNKGDPLLRVKLNLTVPLANLSKHCISSPHIDSSDPLFKFTSILYLNDSDGETIMFNESYNDEFTELTINKKIKPTANTLITFRTDNIHAASLPYFTDKRLVLNICYNTSKNTC